MGPAWSRCLISNVLPAWVALGEPVAVLGLSGESLPDVPCPQLCVLSFSAVVHVSVTTALPWHKSPLSSPCYVHLGYQLIAFL